MKNIYNNGLKALTCALLMGTAAHALIDWNNQEDIENKLDEHSKMLQYFRDAKAYLNNKEIRTEERTDGDILNLYNDAMLADKNASLSNQTLTDDDTKMNGDTAQGAQSDNAQYVQQNHIIDDNQGNDGISTGVNTTNYSAQNQNIGNGSSNSDNAGANGATNPNTEPTLTAQQKDILKNLYAKIRHDEKARLTNINLNKYNEFYKAYDANKSNLPTNLDFLEGLNSIAKQDDNVGREVQLALAAYSANPGESIDFSNPYLKYRTDLDKVTPTKDSKKNILLELHKKVGDSSFWHKTQEKSDRKAIRDAHISPEKYLLALRDIAKRADNTNKAQKEIKKAMDAHDFNETLDKVDFNNPYFHLIHGK
jgi:hypothetical protein